uniref:Uncharacterized protein n=1 Tax=Arundo donax TaxID=35708 RepID=A0A0A9BWX5_ARUDO
MMSLILMLLLQPALKLMLLVMKPLTRCLALHLLMLRPTLLLLVVSSLVRGLALELLMLSSPLQLLLLLGIKLRILGKCLVLIPLAIPQLCISSIFPGQTLDLGSSCVNPVDLLLHVGCCQSQIALRCSQRLSHGSPHRNLHAALHHLYHVPPSSPSHTRIWALERRRGLERTILYHQW